MNRRQFLKLSAVVAASAGSSSLAYAWRIEPHWLEIVRRDLPIANLPAALAGKTLCQVSDLHVGPVVDAAYLRSALDRVSSLHADMIAMTGDFMTTRHNEQIEPVAELMSRLHPAPLGTFARKRLPGFTSR